MKYTTMSPSNEKRVIYTTLDGTDNFDKEAYEEFCDMNDIDYDEDDEESYMDWVSREIELWADDEQCNLDVILEHEIIAIGSMGLWTGKHNYVAKLKSSNIGQALFEVPALFRGIDEVDMYGQDGDISVDCIHHDGTNHITLRKCNKRYSADELIEMLDNGEITCEDVYDMTSSIYNDVAEVYGWHLM